MKRNTNFSLSIIRKIKNQIKEDENKQKKKSSKFHKEWDKWGKNEKH